MQLSDLTDGLRRRWKLFLALSLLVAIALLATFRPVFRLYRTEMRFSVGTQPLDSTLLKEEEKYYLWVASEYVVAGVSDFINAGDFTAQISDNLIRDGYDDLDIEAVDEYVSAGFERSRLIVAVTHPEEQMVDVIAFAVADALLSLDSVELSEVDGPAPVDIQIPQLERSPAFVYPIDSELIVTEIDLTQDVLSAVYPRLGTALVIGLLGVLGAEFFDPTIRTRGSAENLALPILAEIPND